MASASTARRAPTSRWRRRSRCSRPAGRSPSRPEGTIPRGPAFFDPELKGRWGAARLAAATGADVIPIGLWGTEKVWPRSSRLPRLSLADRPEIRVRVGDPVDLKRRSPDADTKRIMAALVDCLPDEARVQRTPTDEELRATFPPGYKGDPHAEFDPPPRHRHLTRGEEPAMADEPRARPEREQRFEKRMRDAEALMWNVEKDPWLNPSGASLIILDRPPDFEHFRKQVAAAVVAVPRLMERVVGGLGRLQPPVWRPDPEFDLDFHIRKMALPAPGSMRQLQDMAAAALPGPVRPHPPAVAVHRHRGPRGRPGRDAVEDPPHRRRRHRRGPPVRGVHPAHPRGARAARGRPRRGARRRRRRRRRGRATTRASSTASSARRRTSPAARPASPGGWPARWPCCGADPLRARDAVGGVVKAVGQLRNELLGGGGPSRRPTTRRCPRARSCCPAGRRCGAPAPATATWRS